MAAGLIRKGAALREEEAQELIVVVQAPMVQKAQIQAGVAFLEPLAVNQKRRALLAEEVQVLTGP